VGLLGRYSSWTYWTDRVRSLAQAAADRHDEPAPVRGTARRLSECDVTELVQRYQQGATVYDLAERFNIHGTTVSGHLRRRGVKMRDKGLGDYEVYKAISTKGAGRSRTSGVIPSSTALPPPSGKGRSPPVQQAKYSSSQVLSCFPRRLSARPRMHVERHHERGAGWAGRMDRHLPNSCLSTTPLELAIEVPRIDRQAVASGEHQARVVPGGTGSPSSGIAPRRPFPQHRQADRPTGPRLRWRRTVEWEM
jgi:hypothetical protein